MTKRVSLLLAPALALALAACSGGGGDAASGDDWCATAQQIEDSSERYDDAFEEGGTTLGEALGEFTSLLDDAEDSAPSEIREAVGTAADGIGRFDELLDEVDYNVFELDESEFAELEAMGDEMDAATDQIEAYNVRECGMSADSDDSDSADDSADLDQVLAPDASSVGDDMTDDESGDDTTGDDTIGDESGGDDTTGDESGDDTGDDMADDVTFSGDPNSDWCVAAQQVEDADAELETLDFTDPEAVESAFNEMIGELENALQVVPPEIAADVNVSYDNFLLLREALIEVEWDFLNADLSVLEDSAEVMQSATDSIEVYNEQVCGIPADSDSPPDDGDDVGDDDDDGFDPGDGTIREQAVAELVATGFTQAEAECIFDRIDFTDPDLDTATMIGVFDQCGIDLARLAELGG